MRRLHALAAAVLAVLAVFPGGQSVSAGAGSTEDLAALVENVPADAIYGARDSTGKSMDTLKIVADPVTKGRYLGVYHSLVNGVFEVRVATSSDLRSWAFVRTLDTNATQPTIAFSPAPRHGVIVAEEAEKAGGGDNHLRFSYYTSVSRLLTGLPYRVFDAPRSLSKCAEGTPNIYSVAYDSPTSTITSGSTIVVGHHYFAGCSTDRQARGTLRNFGQWTTTAQPAVDNALTAAGAPGKHGDRESVTHDGKTYSLIEGNISASFSWAGWRNYLYDHSTRTARQLRIKTRGGSTSFANPSLTRLKGPAGVDSLLVTQFIPVQGAARGEAGTLLYVKPLAPATPVTPSPSTSTDPVVVAAGDIVCAPGATVSSMRCQDRATADSILALNPVAVLTLGDNQYERGTLDGFRSAYARTWGRFKTKTKPTVGNHEYGTANAQGYRDYFGTLATRNGGNLYYSFDVGAWHFIALDSERDLGATGRQVAWLKQDLAAHRNKCVAAFWHKPRFSSGGHGNQRSVQPFWEALYQANAELVLSGHDHNYERFAPQTPAGATDLVRGITQIVAGTGGKSQHSFGTVQPNSAVRNATAFGYVKLTLHASSADVEFIPVNGATFTDRASIRCH